MQHQPEHSQPKEQTTIWNKKSLSGTHLRILGGLLVGAVPAYIGIVSTKSKTPESPEGAAMERRLQTVETDNASIKKQLQELGIRMDSQANDFQRQLTSLQINQESIAGRLRELEHKAGYDASGNNYYQQKR